MNLRNIFRKTDEQTEVKQEDIEKELEKQRIRETEKYKWYMEKCNIAELNSIIIYNFPLATDPTFTEKMTQEELEEITTMIKTARLAMEDQKEQLYGKENQSFKRH